jgi:hypothetical protein
MLFECWKKFLGDMPKGLMMGNRDAALILKPVWGSHSKARVIG